MTETITKAEFDAWNSEERPYVCLMLHRKPRTLRDRLRRRPGEVCPHLMQNVCTRQEAIRKAQSVSEEMPCAVVLFDLEASEVVDRWITDPECKGLDAGIEIGGS